MMRARAWWGLALLGLWGCQRDGTGSVDSESHWMSPCAVDADCGGALRCECGVCTEPCSATCEGTCSPGPLCASAAAPACVPACEGACPGAHLACVDAVCLPLASAADRGVIDAAIDQSVPDAGPDGGDLAMLDMTPVDMTPGDMTPLDMAPVDMAPDGPPPDMAPPLGECAHPDSTCQADVQCGGRPCSALYPTDPCTCLARAPAPTVVACVAGCCGDDCGADTCQAIGLDAQDQLCGDQPAPVDNACVAERCTHDDACGIGMTCIRPGEWGHVRSACVLARCRQDADCDAEPGGRCLGFFTPCHVRGFACAYPSDPCRVDADCPDRGGPRVCLPVEGGGTECAPIP